jgi:glycosyltransferase domain-containing protein
MLKRLLNDLRGAGRGRSPAQSPGENHEQLEQAPLTGPIQVSAPGSSDLLSSDTTAQAYVATALTIIIPSVATRAAFVRSALDHLRHCGITARVIISDHSSPADRSAIAGVVAACPDRDITLLHHEPSLHFLERLSACARAASTPYVVVHADDDFMLPHAIARCVAFLDANADHVACQGRSVFMRVTPDRKFTTGNQRCLSRSEPTARERVAAHCDNFTPTLYAVTRREAFIEANSSTLKFTSNVIFWQYLSSCLMLKHGRLRTLDDLYYVRLDNPGGWRATLVKTRDRSHWPYLLVAPDYSGELSKFKAGLCDVLLAGADSEAEAVADDCCLGLLRRVFGQSQQHDRAELDMLERTRQPGTPEYRAISSCMERSVDALTVTEGS